MIERIYVESELYAVEVISDKLNEVIREVNAINHALKTLVEQHDLLWEKVQDKTVWFDL